MFSEDKDFGALAHVFKRPKVLDPGSCFQRPKIFWILAHVFGRPRVFWAFAHVFRGPKVLWALAHVFSGPKVLDPCSCFQRPRILGL